MPFTAREQSIEAGAADQCPASLPDFLRSKRELLVDQAIQVAKDYGYAQYTTTIRAAWIEAIDTLTDCISTYLTSEMTSLDRPEAEIDYQRDPRFIQMREVAQRHRSLGVTLQLYLGLFKHFRTLYLDAAVEFSTDAGAVAEAQNGLQGFFDAAELSIGADWAEATEDERLMELQARARSVTLDKDRYFSVFESLRDPAFLLNRQRRLINANQAAAELFVGEAGAGEIVYLTSMRGRKTPLEEVINTASSADDGDDGSVWLDTRQGPMCFDLRERAIHDALENTRLGYVVILHDVTPHQRATEDAVRARRAMSRFLATMSHEIRTPLHGVLGATELLRDAETERHAVYVDAIETAGRHLLQTLNKVLDYSRLEARPPEPTLQVCRLLHRFEDYCHFALVWARQAKVPMSFSVAGNLPQSVLIDWDMTQQILTNLVSNAIRNDSGAGVKITVRRRRGDGDRPLLRFEVLDNGPGIAPDVGDILFEPFAARKPGAGNGGAGLGLAISRRLIEAMGGSIGFRNRRAGGAAFWFDLPYRRVEVRAAPDDPRVTVLDDAAPDDAVPTTQRLSCLLVDDDQISRMVTADQLRRRGMSVMEVETSAAALACARETAFDVFLVDYYLSDGDGATLVGRLRSDGMAGDAPRFIALTANADLVSRTNGKGHPFDALLAKPAAGDALIRAILPEGGEIPAQRPETQPQTSANCLSDLSPRIVDAMAAAFTTQWDGEAGKFRAALADGDLHRLADLAHRVASSCAVMGITDLAAMLRDLEFECRRGQQRPDLGAWQVLLDPHLRTAPKRARALAAEVSR
ncbi:ATP-binding protein [Pelagibius sp. Alg239-R121]|uniref:ATP-binding protein n=1 Tax=Pelagibius sp. Alg239-R121 TaxID=2993448 RepID=UPI0024A7A1AE|nr:ATP-binding protein [Pelagibius sp. Alg239-R121]